MLVRNAEFLTGISLREPSVFGSRGSRNPDEGHEEGKVYSEVAAVEFHAANITG